MPRTIVVEQTVFKFSELSDRAKQRAKEKLFSDGYDNADESIKSIKALAEHFNGKMSDWEIDFYNCGPSSAKFTMPNDITAADIHERLETLGSYDPKTLRGNGDCKLTGCCWDECAIDGFRKMFLEGRAVEAGEAAKRLPTWATEEVGATPVEVEPEYIDLEPLMQAAFSSWLTSCQEDAEYQMTDEAFCETCESNGYEFDENGAMI